MTFQATSEAPASRPGRWAEFQSGHDEHRRKLHVFPSYVIFGVVSPSLKLFDYPMIVNSISTTHGR